MQSQHDNVKYDRELRKLAEEHRQGLVTIDVDTNTVRSPASVGRGTFQTRLPVGRAADLFEFAARLFGNLRGPMTEDEIKEAVRLETVHVSVWLWGRRKPPAPTEPLRPMEMSRGVGNKLVVLFGDETDDVSKYEFFGVCEPPLDVRRRASDNW